jgi:hypothetical protein
MSTMLENNNLKNKVFKQPPLSARERYLLKTLPNVLEKPLNTGTFSSMSIEFIKNTMVSDQTYAFVQTQPNKHTHRYLVIKHGDTLNITFFEDESDKADPENRYIVHAVVAEDGSVVINSVQATSIELFYDLDDQLDIKIFREITEQMQSDMVSIINPGMRDDQAAIPINSRIIHPDGKIQTTFQVDKNHLRTVNQSIDRQIKSRI